jgi:uroporphyrinogen III methyltransferase/synthase
VLHLQLHGAKPGRHRRQAHTRTIIACIGPKTAETAAEFGLRVDVQPDTAAVGPLVDALAEHAARLRAEGALPPPRKKSRRR